MTAPKTVLCAIGTRPEAIKMAPVILALRADPAFRCRVLATAQHRQMLDQVLSVFGIVPDVDLDIMQPDQSLCDLTGRLLLRLGAVMAEEAPDIVLAQGDTTTVMTTAIAAFYARVPFGHVEAGLRTGDPGNPFPEEMNRVLTARLARWHFAPTPQAAHHLRAENTPAHAIHVTGNTVIDALHQVRDKARRPACVTPGRRLILATLHRRENFGAPLVRICAALRAIVEANEDVELLLPVHHNPNVRATITEAFRGCGRALLTDPLDYLDFVGAMKHAHMVMSDSGGVQEEAPALGKPVLILRETTERPEAVEAGVAALVGTDAGAIRARAQRLLDDPAAYAAMARGASPFGDGQAARRILEVLRAV